MALMNQSDTTIKRCIERIAATIVNYSEEDSIAKIIDLLSILKSRRSLLNLLFLKMTLARVPKEKVVSVFEDFDGIKILESTSSSLNGDFLNVLLEIFIYLDFKRPILISILNSYALIDPSIFYAYLNNSCGLYALFETGGNQCTYLKTILAGILSQEAIGNELDFVFNISRDSRFDPKEIDITGAKEKFKSQAYYERLAGFLPSNGKPGSEVGQATRIDATPSQQAVCSCRGQVECRSKMVLFEKIKAELDDLKEESIVKAVELRKLSKALESERALNSQLMAKTNDLEKMNQILADEVEKCERKPAQPGGSIADQLQGISLKEKESERDAETVIKPSSGSGESAGPDKKDAPKAKTGRFAKKPGVKSKLETKQAYCGLKWKKIPKLKNSIFNEINVRDVEAIFELEEFKYFEAKQSKPEPEKRVVREETKTVEYMDPKKSYALNIALGRVKTPNKELYNSIVSREYTNENVIKQLLLYLPTLQELENVKGGDASTFGRAEQFIYEIDDLELFEEALYALKFTQLYTMRDYQKIISENIGIFQNILNSAELRKLFACCLVIGNQLNINTFNGKADAFDFNSLDEFKTKPVRELINRKVRVEALRRELGNLEMDIPIDAIVHEIREIRAFHRQDVVDPDKYHRLCSDFEQMLLLRQNVQKYLNVENDDSFIAKLMGTMDYFQGS